MSNADSFMEKYEKYSDKELYEVYETIENLTDEEKNALYKAIEERGGLDTILNNIHKTKDMD
ncbi:MAG: hypothetical protein ABI402_09845 [Ferruginibacter sp.]